MRDVTTGTEYYYLPEEMHSVSALADASGHLVESYRYDVYGKVTMTDSQGQPIEQSTVGNPYFFTGRRLDFYSDSAGRLKQFYDYRARTYDPENGRFLQRDPKGYVDGGNLYEAFGSNPARFCDPMGTDLFVEGSLGTDWENDEETARIEVWLDPRWYWFDSRRLAIFLLDIEREKPSDGLPATRAWVTLGHQRYRVRLAALRAWVTENLNRDISAIAWGSLEPTDEFVQTLVVSSFTDWLTAECSGIVNIHTGEPLPGWDPDDASNVAVGAASVQRGLDEAHAMAQAGLKNEIYALATAAFAEAAWKGIQFARGVRNLRGTSAGVRGQPAGPTNWRGQPVELPEGHVMSPLDPHVSAPPRFRGGPFTSAQRDAFLRGTSGGTNLAPHHRHQIPIRSGGVIDELPGPGHPGGNQHTAGVPRRHQSSSVFRSMQGGEGARQAEIRAHWIEKGQRLVETAPGVWVDPGPQL